MSVIKKPSGWHHFFARSIGKITVITAVLLYASLFIVWQANHSPAREPKVTLHHLEQKYKDRSSLVEVGMYINNFQSFSIQHNEFSIDAIVWFKFPAGSESLETIQNFSIKNSFILNSGDIVYKAAPIIKLLDNDVIVSYNVLATFKTDLLYTNFPLSNHTVNIHIENRSVTPYELYFTTKPNNLVIDPHFKYILNDWTPVNYAVDTGYTLAAIDSQNPSNSISYPVALFSIEFANVGHRVIIALYFPMLVLFLIALFCLLLDVTDSSRLAYVATAIPLLVLFRMVIDSASPQVSYLTHLDYIYYTLVLLSLLITLFQAFISFFIRSPENLSPEIINKLNKINTCIFFALLMLLIIFITYSYFR